MSVFCRQMWKTNQFIANCNVAVGGSYGKRKLALVKKVIAQHHFIVYKGGILENVFVIFHVR